ncbi:hypothetical protein AWM68_17245 [Fictibacillus phosphorivorans]|uniref:Uncharacterized protein n=1 Tax=Fictibacillus phosphorivorans TaxID=1221500 RepID=A0A161RUU4_9BACL|nr:hypothetical protein [Fictibacillus phosphorivorans]KZE68046.1 hypothetical protein AWM68_17245 [Fictibacillus phosphorivorans]
MYKITCFAPIEPQQLEKALKGIHFKTVKSGFEWLMDGSVFRIEPFQNQPRDSMKAYRIYFNGDINGGTYLFDLTLGCMDAVVTGIEYILEDSSMKHDDWMNELIRKPSYHMIDSRGLFSKQEVGVTLVNNTVTLQLRSRKNQKLKMWDCLKRIDFIREELQPVKYDLFSIEEEIA